MALYVALVVQVKNGRHCWFTTPTSLRIIGRQDGLEARRIMQKYLETWARREVLEMRDCGKLRYFRFVKHPDDRVREE
jgi:hypothetical protein